MHGITTLMQEKPKLPYVPGNECSGTVAEVGRDVRTLKVGDKVSAAQRSPEQRSAAQHAVLFAPGQLFWRVLGGTALAEP